MNACVLALLPAVLGVDFGWERKPDNTIEYVIQIDPEAVESMKTGSELISDLPPQLRNITTYKIKVGRDRLPNHNQLPPELLGAPMPAPTGAPLGAPAGTLGAPIATPLPGNASTAAYGPTGSYNPATGYNAAPTGYPGTTGYNTAPAGTASYQPVNGYQPTTGATMPQPTGGFVNASDGTTPGTTVTGYDAYGRPYATTPAAAPAGYTATPGNAGTAYANGGVTYDRYGNPIYVAANPTLPTGAPLTTPNVSTAGFPISTTNGYAVNPVGTTGTTGGYYVAPGYDPRGGVVVNPATGLPIGAYQPQPQATGAYAPAGTNAYGRYEGPAFPNGAPPVSTLNAKPALDGGATGSAGGPAPGFANSSYPTDPQAAAQAAGREPLSANDPRYAQHAGAAGTASAAADKSPQWMSLTLSLVALFASMGANMYFGWTTYHLRERYRMLLSDRVPTY